MMVTNIIIALEREGWDGDKIDEFLKFIGTHEPSESDEQEKKDA